MRSWSFDEDTPAEIIRGVQPDVLVKGADWPADQIVGRDTVEARGGRVVRVPVEQGYSTTSIVERIRRQPIDARRCALGLTRARMEGSCSRAIAHRAVIHVQLADASGLLKSAASRLRLGVPVPRVPG